MLKDAAKSGGEISELIFSSDIERDGEEEDYNVEEFISDCVRDLNQHGKFIDKYYILSSELFQKLSQTEHGRKVIGVVEKPNWDNRDSKKREKEEIHIGQKNILVLDRLQDPGNMGTILRTADASGFSEVIAIKGTVDAYSPKVVRSAAGSIIRIPITYVDGPDEMMERIASIWQSEKSGKSESGKKGTIIATQMMGEVNLWDAELSGPVAVIIGNEGSGVSDELNSMADQHISIPMNGTIESLNAGVAAAILMYEVLRQQSK